MNIKPYIISFAAIVAAIYIGGTLGGCMWGTDPWRGLLDQIIFTIIMLLILCIGVLAIFVIGTFLSKLGAR